MRFKLVEDDVQPTHKLVTTPTKGPVPLEKSYNQDETLMYVYIQTNHGNINITLDLIENLNN